MAAFIYALECAVVLEEDFDMLSNKEKSIYRREIKAKIADYLKSDNAADFAKKYYENDMPDEFKKEPLFLFVPDFVDEVFRKKYDDKDEREDAKQSFSWFMEEVF